MRRAVFIVKSVGLGLGLIPPPGYATVALTSKDMLLVTWCLCDGIRWDLRFVIRSYDEASAESKYELHTAYIPYPRLGYAKWIWNLYASEVFTLIFAMSISFLTHPITQFLHSTCPYKNSLTKLGLQMFEIFLFNTHLIFFLVLSIEKNKDLIYLNKITRHLRIGALVRGLPLAPVVSQTSLCSNGGEERVSYIYSFHI